MDRRPRRVPTKRPRVGLMKRSAFHVRRPSAQHKAQLRFVGQAEKLDERVPDIQLRVGDSKSPIEPPVRVLAQDRGSAGADSGTRVWRRCGPSDSAAASTVGITSVTPFGCWSALRADS